MIPLGENASLSSPQSVRPVINRLTASESISFPVYDDNGILLLAAGSKVTPEIRRSLILRGLERLVLQTSDDAVISVADVEPNGAPVALLTESARHLDALLGEDCNLEIANIGSAMKERTCRLVCRPYDRRQLERLARSHRQNVGSLCELMTRVMRKEMTNADRLREMAANYLYELSVDADCALTSVFRIGDLLPEAVAIEVSLLSMAIGIETGLDAGNVCDLGICGLVSDWGMARVPESLRYATRRLTPEEMAEIKKHPISAVEMLSQVSRLPRMAALVVYQSHESPNGTGYPRGRTGTAIHPFASIIHVAKAYAALTKRRPYRAPLMRYSAMEWLLRQAREGIVAPKMVRALLATQSLFPIGSFVRLSDGCLGQVLRRNGDDYEHPIVQLVADANGVPFEQESHGSRVSLAESKLQVAGPVPTPGREEIEFNPDHLH